MSFGILPFDIVYGGPQRSKKLTSMLLVTHLWQVTNELANPFGQSAYTLDQKLQTQGAFLLCWFYKFTFKGCFHQWNEYLSEAKFLTNFFWINQMALEFIRNSSRILQEFSYFLLDKIPTQNSSKITKDICPQFHFTAYHFWPELSEKQTAAVLCKNSNRNSTH